MDRHNNNNRAERIRALLVWCLAICSAQAFAAGVEVDGATPTTLDSAPNGVPIVNIAAPNGQGLSHNSYIRFNVTPSGLILNNANQTVVNTQLGGQIFGNSQLIDPARVILNEVTSTHPSFLNGYTEVAGPGADVVIANPNGLSINGAGFINVPRATLTTGVPVIDAFGNLSGFDVRGGEITIFGDGLDTQFQDATSIYTHYLNLNAKLHARDLDVALGKNQIDYPGRKIVSSSNGTLDRVLLDSSALGGMYANKIVLVGTDKGLGMNLPPEVIASSGDIEISADGRLVLQQLDAGGDIAVASNENIASLDTVYAGGAVDFSATDAVVVSDGMVGAEDAIRISAAQVDNQATLIAGLEADGDRNTRGQLVVDAELLSNHAEMIATDRVAVTADVIDNFGLIDAGVQLTLTADRLDNRATLFSGMDMDLRIREELVNNQDATLFAMRNMLLGADGATGKTTQITNYLGTIQSYGGDIDINATRFDNLGEADIQYELVYFDLGNNREVTSPAAAMNINLAYSSGYTKHNSTARRRWVTEVLRRLSIQAPHLYSANAGYISGNRYANFLAIDTRLIDLSSTTPALLDSGNNLLLHVDDFNNQDSIVAASGDIVFDVSGGYLNQAQSHSEAVTDYRYYTHAHHSRRGWSSYDKYSSVHSSGYIPVADTETVSSNTVTQAGGSILGQVGGAAVNQGVLRGQHQSSNGVDIASLAPAKIDLPSNEYGMFVRATSPDSAYLVETNPRFTEFSSFAGSSYLLDRLDFSGAETLRRLGDAFYESKLIRDAVFAQSGRRYLDPSIQSDQAQFQRLMDNALIAQHELELAPGVALEVEQINRLTEDIVWLEREEVDGEDVLVPRVYLASTRRGEIRGGRVIAGEDVIVQIASLANSGLLDAGGDLQLDAAEGIENRGAISAGEGLTLTAVDDIENRSGRIEGDRVALTSAEGDIVNLRNSEEYRYASGDVEFSTTLIDEAGEIRGNTSVALDAAGEIRVEGSVVDGGAVSLEANSVSIDATAQSEAFFSGDDDNFVRESSLGHLASTIVGDEIVILSAGDTGVRGSRLEASGELRIEAAALDVESVNDSEYFSSRYSRDGTFSETVATQKRYRSRNRGSELHAATVVLVTDRGDIELTGSEVQAGTRLAINSAGDIRIAAGHDDTLDESYRFESGWFSGSSLYSQSEDLEGRVTQTAVNARVTAGNVDLVAAGDVELAGVDAAVDGEFSASARDITIENAVSEETSYSKHTRINVGFDDVVENLSDIDDFIEEEDGKLTLTLGEASYEHAEVVTTETTAVASQIAAGSIALNAGGEAAGDILVRGSDLAADGSISLQASGDVALLDAHHTQSSERLSQSGTAEVNLTLQNEYDQVARAIKAVKQAERDLRHAEDDFDAYKDELRRQEAEYGRLQAQVAAGEGFIEQADVDEFERHLARLRDDREFYETNIALAAVTLTTKTTQLIQQTGRAAGSSATYGFNMGLELDIDALEQQVDTFYRQSRATTLSASDISVEAGDTATVRGSILQAQNDIDVVADEIEILAGESTTREDTRDQHVNYTYTWDLLGGNTGAAGQAVGIPGLPEESLGGSVSGDGSRQNDASSQQANSQLLAGNVRLSSTGDTTIEGANIHAGEGLEIEAENLDVRSVQDIGYSETRSQGLSYSGSGSGLNAAESDSEQVQTVVTSLTGGQVEINVADHTEIRGAVIAAIDADGNDNGQLKLSTDTLRAGSLNNTSDSTSRSIGVNAGEMSSLDYQSDTDHERTKSLATLGSGDIQIGDVDGSDTRLLNTDITDTEVAIYDLESHQGLSGELDTRLLSEAGRDEILEDWVKSGMIANTIALIATTDKVGVEDFFDETEKHHSTYQAVKLEIANDPLLSAALQNPDLTPAQKKQMLDQLTSAVMVELGYKAYENNIVATDLLGRDAAQVHGFYSTDTGEAYINDARLEDTAGLVTTAGHEATRAMDHQKGVDFDQNREDRTIYAENYGVNLAIYTDLALDIGGYDSGLAMSNNHVGNTSEYVATNNEIFAGLDKNQGDNYLNHQEKRRYNIMLNALFECDANGGCSKEIIEEYSPAVTQLLMQDQESDARLEAACRVASSDACRAEVEKVRKAFATYRAVQDRKELYGENGTGSEYVQVGMLLGDYQSEAMSDNAKRAIVSIPVDTVTGVADLTVIGTRAIAGDEQAQQQVAVIVDGIQRFIENPADAIEQNIKAQLDEADRLEAMGDINKAEEIRSRVVIEGAFAVTGLAGGAMHLVRVSIPVAKPANSNSLNILNHVNPSSTKTVDYKSLVGVGSDVANDGLPTGYRFVVSPNGDIVVRGPDNEIFEVLEYGDETTTPYNETVLASPDVPDFTYRGTKTPPEVVFSEGFKARGTSPDLLLHALDNTDPASMYVSTSRSQDIGVEFATYGFNVDGYLYILRPRNDSLDVNVELGAQSPHRREVEIAIPYRVDYDDVRAVTPLNADGSYKYNYTIINPNWNANKLE